MAVDKHRTRRTLLKAAAAMAVVSPFALPVAPAGANPLHIEHERADLLLGYYAFLVAEMARLERELAVPHLHPNALAAGAGKSEQLSAAARPIDRAEMLEAFSRGWALLS